MSHRPSHGHLAILATVADVATRIRAAGKVHAAPFCSGHRVIFASASVSAGENAEKCTCNVPPTSSADAPTPVAVVYPPRSSVKFASDAEVSFSEFASIFGIGSGLVTMLFSAWMLETSQPTETDMNKFGSKILRVGYTLGFASFVSGLVGFSHSSMKRLFKDLKADVKAGKEDLESDVDHLRRYLIGCKGDISHDLSKVKWDVNDIKDTMKSIVYSKLHRKLYGSIPAVSHVTRATKDDDDEIDFSLHNDIDGPLWEGKHYKTVIRLIAANPYHAVRLKEVHAALKKVGIPANLSAADVLYSMVKFKQLFVRPYSTMARDIPREAFFKEVRGVEEEDAVVKMPSPAHLYHVLQLEKEFQKEDEEGKAEEN